MRAQECCADMEAKEARGPLHRWRGGAPPFMGMGRRRPRGARTAPTRAVLAIRGSQIVKIGEVPAPAPSASASAPYPN